MFSWQEQYLTRSLRSLVRYCSRHSNIKFISSRHRVTELQSLLLDVINFKPNRHWEEYVCYTSRVLFQRFPICDLRPFLALAFLIFMANFSVNEATCRKEKMTWGSALVNHTYKTLNVSNFIACVLKCDEDPQCRSCNFWWNKLECELNYAATYSAATSFIREVNCVHRDMDWEPGMHNNLNSFSFFFLPQLF